MAGAVWMVSGSKGGVGKSIVFMALSHYLSKRGEEVLLVEADIANPDVRKAYGKSLETVYLNLDEKDGWMDLANRLAERPEQTIVINTASRSGEGVKLCESLLPSATATVGHSGSPFGRLASVLTTRFVGHPLLGLRWSWPLSCRRRLGSQMRWSS